MADTESLWQVMDDAYDKSVPPAGKEWQNSHGYAAEIRALADWLEAMWAAQQPTPESSLPFVQGLSMGMKLHREGTLNILRAEADRVEAGV